MMNSFKMKLSKRIMAICLAATIILGSAFNHVGQVFANTEGGGSETCPSVSSCGCLVKENSPQQTSASQRLACCTSGSVATTHTQHEIAHSWRTHARKLANTTRKGELPFLLIV